MPYTGYRVKTPNYKGNSRYFLLERNVIFKTLREEQGKKLYEEILNELVCFNFGLRLGIPIATTTFEKVEGNGLGLCSVVIGEEEFRPTDQSQKSTITNLDQLKTIFVFDQWVFNTDRQPRHIILGDEPNANQRKILYAIDHGHTLNDYKGGRWSPASFTQQEAEKKAEPIYFDYGVRSISEITEAINSVKAFSDRIIENVIDSVVLDIESKDLNSDETSRLEGQASMVKMILKSRRDKLNIILNFAIAFLSSNFH